MLLFILCLNFCAITIGVYARTDIVAIHQLEAELNLLINQERAKYGLMGLSPWKILSDTARKHSKKMADGAVPFGHAGFEERLAALRKHSGLVAFGENVAFCKHVDDPLKVAVDMWMNSPGHRDNILDDFNETGIAIAWDDEGGVYITQLFAKRKKS